MIRTILPKMRNSASKVVRRKTSCASKDSACPIALPCCWTTLNNGVRVISEENHSGLACVTLMIEAGPRYETACNNGIAMFIEHMAFKGFDTLSKATLDARIRAIGGTLTAKTTREWQSFTAVCPSESAGIVVRYLARIISDLEFLADEILSERTNISQEIIERDKDPKDVLFDYLHATAYQGTSLAQPVHGTTNNIKLFDKSFSDLYLREHYRPQRIVLAASGAFSHPNFIDFASKSALGRMQPAVTCDDVDLFACRFTASEVLYRDDSMPYCHVAIAVEAAGYGSKDYILFRVLNNIVGSWHKIRGGGQACWTHLAQAGALADFCESYKSFYIPYRDTGLFGIYFVSKRMDVEDMLYNVQQTWMHLCLTVQLSEVERAINDLKLQCARNVAGAVNSCGDMGLQMMYTDCRQNLAELNDKLSSLYVPHIKTLTNKYLYDRCPVVAAVGPTENLPDYNRIRSGMYWLRV